MDRVTWHFAEHHGKHKVQLGGYLPYSPAPEIYINLVKCEMSIDIMSGTIAHTPNLKDYIYNELIELGIKYIKDEKEIPSILQLYNEIIEDNNIYINIGRLNIEAMHTYIITLNRIKLLEDIDARYQQELQHITPIIVEAIKTTNSPQ